MKYSAYNPTFSAGTFTFQLRPRGCVPRTGLRDPMGIQFLFSDGCDMARRPCPAEHTDGRRLVLRNTRVGRLRHDCQCFPLGHHRHDPSPHRCANAPLGLLPFAGQTRRLRTHGGTPLQVSSVFRKHAHCPRVHVCRLPLRPERFRDALRHDGYRLRRCVCRFIPGFA